MDRFHKLFWECYVKNCEIDKEEINEADLEAIKEMDREKLYKHFRLFIGGLLEFKNQVKNLEATELAQRNMQFESMITKLEGDIRAHIAKHYQLRLEIETHKNTIDELNSVINTEKNENKDLKFKVLQQEKIIEQYKCKLEPKRTSTDSRKKINYIDIEILSQLNNAKSSKSSKNSTKILTDRAKLLPGPIQPVKKLLGASRSLKTRVGHIRCKSEFTKSLKILIPQ